MLFPSLALVKETLETYLREVVAKKLKVQWICICSDESLGKDPDVTLYTDDVGVPCHTDVNYIREWLRKTNNDNRYIFTTYQSGDVFAKAFKGLRQTIDLGIFDEAHRTVGNSAKLFSHLLHDKNIKITKRIFMTATEKFYGGSKDDIFSMDDVNVYGDTFSFMSFKDAIKDKLLTDYRIIKIDVSDAEIANFINQNRFLRIKDSKNRKAEARSLAAMIALRKAMRKYPIKNAVSFHATIDKAKKGMELHPYITKTFKYKAIDAYTVSGKMPVTKRNKILREFVETERSLVTNAKCLTEGVDVPAIDSIIFSDPKRSRIDIVQAVGRALRVKRG